MSLLGGVTLDLFQLGHGDYQSHSCPKEVSFFSPKHVEQIACGMRHSLVLLKEMATGLCQPKTAQDRLGQSRPMTSLVQLGSACLRQTTEPSTRCGEPLARLARPNLPSSVQAQPSFPATPCHSAMPSQFADVTWQYRRPSHRFGSGKRGQLGVSKDKVRSLSLPHPCSGFEGAEVVSIIANGDHSAALSANGEFYTWGRGFSSGSDVSVPQVLHSSLSFKQAALGWNHALVLTGEQEVFMLGGNHHGVLSVPRKITRVHNSSDSVELSPSKVTGLDEKQVMQIAAGAEHSAIVTENGQLWTWGWGEHGQLGLGNTSDHICPQLVDLGQISSNNNNLSSRVYCGSGFTFALKTRSALSD